MNNYNRIMVLRKIAIFALITLVFMQWTTLQHDVDHMHEAFYIAHCEDEKKEDSKELNHCENCSIFNHLAHVISNEDHTLLNRQLNSTLHNSYRIFAFTHFYSINSVRGPPQIS